MGKYIHPKEDEIINYRDRGLSYDWISRQINVSKSTVARVCKHNGCSGKLTDQSATAKQKLIKAITAGGQCEYVDGYEGQNSFIILRCLECGCEFTKAKTTLDHNTTNIHCPGCAEIRRNKNKAERKVQREKAKDERKRIKAAKIAAIRAAAKEAKKHPCAVCGGETTNPKYCSRKCAGKAESKRKEITRSRKIKDAIIDKDITLQALYTRDNGICHICGRKCDYDDFIETDGVIIAGNEYPSIDHVIPLSKGGKHSWNNVALAHRLCNSVKADKMENVG